MNKDIKQLDKLQKRLENKRSHRRYNILSSAGIAIVRLIYVIIEILLSLLSIILLTLPVLLILFIRRVIAKKNIFVHKTIYGANAKPLKLHFFNIEAWLPKHAPLFCLVITRKLDLVGVSFRDYNSINISSGDPFLVKFKPGIFNLHFIQSSSRIAHGSQNQTDWDYLHHRKGLNDLVVLLLSIPAILYHQTDAVLQGEMNIFGIKMLNMTMDEALTLIDQRLVEAKKTPVYFVNPDCLNKVFTDHDYYEILDKNEVIFPDGIGINLAGKMLGTPMRQNLNGTDMLPNICELAQKKGYKLFLLGAAPTIAETMKDKLIQKYPDLQICGVEHGFFDWETDAARIIEHINTSETDILLVAFGAPRQEKFIARYGDMINAKIQMGVGGLFDFYSERIARAPIWMRQIGLEWFFRLLQEPKRMWKRYIIGNPVFLFRVLRWKMNKDA